MRSFLAFAAFAALLTGVARADHVPAGLKLAMANFTAAKSYHMSVTGNNTTIEIDTVKPNRSHSFVNGAMETIQIGPMTYTRLNGTWIKASQPDADPASFAKDLANVNMDDPSVKFADRGLTTVGGHVYHRYTYVTTQQPDQVVTIDVGADNEIHRISSGANGAILFSKYNAPIRITAPI